MSRYDGHSFQTFTTQEGLAVDAVWSILQNREGIFWFGTEEGLSRYDGRRFQTFTTEDGLGGNNVWPILQDQEGALWFGTKGGGVSRYDGRTFTTFTTQDGLGDNALEAIFQDREGSLWFGTWGGLSRYDSQLSATFTTEDGLADNEVLAILQDRAGVFWLGTSGGLSRYDGRTFTTFTVQDGLAANRVSGIFQDREGNLWFGHSEQTSGKGVTRYDGHCFTVFSAQDGLGSDRVGAIFQDQAGNLWFGVPGGVSRYDGEYFEYFAAADGLLAFVVGSIFQDQEGMLWFGSVWGLSRYDGRTFTSQEGLVAKWVRSICQAQGGDMWLGTQGEGVLRYNGQSVKSITTQDGLADDVVYSVLCDPRGRIWFGTPSGGVSLYDGQVFQSFTIHEGLGANNVGAILHDQAGNLWFGTTKGVTRYRPALPSSPPMYIDAVVADRRYEGETEISIPASVRLLAFEFHGISFKTRPEAMVYRYRLEGYVEDWRNTHSRRVEYQDLPVGEYTFEVRAVDRDLNYSAPARVHLKVIPDPRDQKIDELEQRVRERTRRLEEANEALSDANKELFRTLQEKEKAQELLVRSESMAAIGTLVAGVAHELNNPLGAAYSLTQTVQEMIEEDTPEQLQQEKAEIVGHLAFSRKELNRAKEIVAALLGLSRQNQDYTEAVEMNTVVQDALRVLYNQYKKYDLNLVEEYAEGLPVVQGNFAQLGQVCMNLIKNAIEALKGQEGQIVLKTYRDEEQVVFECADTGPGMPAEVRQRIFQPFFTTKAPGEGTGLGLYICHQTVEKHKGMIEVESEMGKGTVFRVKLPMRSI